MHLVARAAQTGSVRPAVDLDVLGLQPMVRHGSFTNDETPFRGVRALPNGTVLTCRTDGTMRAKHGTIPKPEPAPRRAQEARERVAPLAEALLGAAQPLARHGEPVRLALSGGRDSRLMAAVLYGAGVPLYARTYGFADDPDVLLATRIAQALGIEHRVQLTAAEQPDAVTVGHPLTRAHHIIRICEGMNSAYERVNGYAPYVMEPRTSGSGGETLRGGFLYGQDDVSPDGLQKRVRLIFRAGEKYLTAAANERARALHEAWIEKISADGFDVLDKLYLFYRTGRWIVGSHTATLMNSPYYHPFFDNRVVRETLTLPGRVATQRGGHFPAHRDARSATARHPPGGQTLAVRAYPSLAAN